MTEAGPKYAPLRTVTAIFPVKKTRRFRKISPSTQKEERWPCIPAVAASEFEMTCVVRCFETEYCAP